MTPARLAERVCARRRQRRSWGVQGRSMTADPSVTSGLTSDRLTSVSRPSKILQVDAHNLQQARGSDDRALWRYFEALSVRLKSPQWIAVIKINNGET